jgi:pyridoxine 5'-phosphate synthase PdxJ
MRYSVCSGIPGLCCGALLVIVGDGVLPQDKVEPIPVEVRERQRPAKSEDVASLMHAKLEHSRTILEGMVTHDFEKVAEAAESLKLMSVKPPQDWEPARDEDGVYEHFRMEFLRNAARLEEEARQKHLAGTAWFQQNLTATCIACHDYIRDDGPAGN